MGTGPEAKTGYDLALTTGVRESECTALRRRWGKDAVRRS